MCTSRRVCPLHVHLHHERGLTSDSADQVCRYGMTPILFPDTLIDIVLQSEEMQNEAIEVGELPCNQLRLSETLKLYSTASNGPVHYREGKFNPFDWSWKEKLTVVIRTLRSTSRRK